VSKLPVVFGAANQTAVENSTAGGHIANRDVNADTYNIRTAVFSPPQSETRLARLFRKLKSEASGDAFLTEYISELQIFTRVVENESVVGVEQKLLAADRFDQVDMAVAMKEMIYGELRKKMFSKTFQTIYATLMGKIYEDFDTIIRPLIAGGADRATIDAAVNAHIVKPLVAELEQCPEYEDAPTQTVRGMIWFLTGNCHLRWN
jgi:hypothetical protein